MRARRRTGIAALFGILFAPSALGADEIDPWSRLPAILANIRAPSFPSRDFAITASENVLIQGVTIVNAPMWLIHPVLSKNVTVRQVKVISAGPNNDGCDPESSSDVLIEDTLFDTGDDCIAIKSGRNADGRRLNVPVERVVVRGCQSAAATAASPSAAR